MIKILLAASPVAEPPVLSGGLNDLIYSLMTGTFSLAHLTLNSASFRAFDTDLYSLFLDTNALKASNFD